MPSPYRTQEEILADLKEKGPKPLERMEGKRELIPTIEQKTELPNYDESLKKQSGFQQLTPSESTKDIGAYIPPAPGYEETPGTAPRVPNTLRINPKTKEVEMVGPEARSIISTGWDNVDWANLDLNDSETIAAINNRPANLTDQTNNIVSRGADPDKVNWDSKQNKWVDKKTGAVLDIPVPTPHVSTLGPIGIETALKGVTYVEPIEFTDEETKEITKRRNFQEREKVIGDARSFGKEVNPYSEPDIDSTGRILSEHQQGKAYIENEAPGGWLDFYRWIDSTGIGSIDNDSNKAIDPAKRRDLRNPFKMSYNVYAAYHDFITNKTDISKMSEEDRQKKYGFSNRNEMYYGTSLSNIEEPSKKYIPFDIPDQNWMLPGYTKTYKQGAIQIPGPEETETEREPEIKLPIFEDYLVDSVDVIISRNKVFEEVKDMPQITDILKTKQGMTVKIDGKETWVEREKPIIFTAKQVTDWIRKEILSHPKEEYLDVYNQMSRTYMSNMILRANAVTAFSLIKKSEAGNEKKSFEYYRSLGEAYQWSIKTPAELALDYQSPNQVILKSKDLVLAQINQYPENNINYEPMQQLKQLIASIDPQKASTGEEKIEMEESINNMSDQVIVDIVSKYSKQDFTWVVPEGISKDLAEAQKIPLSKEKVSEIANLIRKESSTIYEENLQKQEKIIGDFNNYIDEWGFNLSDPEFIDLYAMAYKASALTTEQLMFERHPNIFSGYGMHLETILTATQYQSGSNDHTKIQSEFNLNTKTAKQVVEDIEKIIKLFDYVNLYKKEKEKFESIKNIQDRLLKDFNPQFGGLIAYYLREETTKGYNLENSTILKVQKGGKWTPTLINQYAQALELQARHENQIWEEALHKARQYYKPIQEKKIEEQEVLMMGGQTILVKDLQQYQDKRDKANEEQWNILRNKLKGNTGIQGVLKNIPSNKTQNVVGLISMVAFSTIQKQLMKLGLTPMPLPPRGFTPTALIINELTRPEKLGLTEKEETEAIAIATKEIEKWWQETKKVSNSKL